MSSGGLGVPANNASGNAAETPAAMRQDANRGVPVHTFNPDAPPQEKAAQVIKSRDYLDSVKPQEPQQREIKVDSNAAPAIPTIVVESHEEKEKEKEKLIVKAKDTPQVTEQVQEEEAMPGAIPSKAVSVIPDWYKVGWRQVSGIDEPHLSDAEEKDKRVLETFLSEQFYGAWYHNAAIIVIAVFATHFLTRFNFGWGWLFIVLAFCSTYYSASIERFRQYARDDIQRELVKTRLASEHESADWINNFLDRFWVIYEPVLSATIVASAEQILTTSTPAFLDSLKLTQFTLGSKAPRVDRVRTFPKTDEDIVMMDWGFSFTPKDTSNMTQKQIADQSNPKIVLQVRLGKGLATAALPILVEDVSFQGLMRIRLKLMPNFPHVQTVDMCFLEKPTIGYVLKPIGGETFGFDIASIPGLSSFIRDMTHATLGPMMYDPNVFTLNLEQMLSGKPLDAAIGVVQVVIHSARGIQGTKIGGGTPDPYASLSISGRAELARTRYKANTYNPTWVETKYLLVNSLKDNLTLSIYDYNEHRKNSMMGTATFEFSKLLEDSTHEGIVSPILKDGKPRGELRYDVNYYPVLEPEEGQNERVSESTVGIVRLVIHQAKELDHTKSLSGELNPVAKVWLNSERTASFSSICIKHTNNPVWEAPHEFLCTDKENATVTLRIIDDRDFLKDPVVGYLTVKLTDLLDSSGQAGKDWFPLSGCRTGKMRLSAEWKPLAMAGSLHGSDQYKPPIGVVKLLIDKAIDVKNVEATLGGKSDPYVRVQVRNVTKARTEVINNNLNPIWDQIMYIPIHSLKEIVMLECMDYQNLTRDRSLGSVELRVADLAAESPEDIHYPYQSKGIRSFTEPMRLDKGNALKGTLFYTAEFIPSLNVKFDKFEEQNLESKQLTQDDGDGGIATDEEGSDDESYAPVGVTVQSSPKKEKHRSMDNMSVKTTDTSKTDKSTKSNVTDASKGTSGTDEKGAEEKKPAETGIEMTREELLKEQSGIIVFHVISGQLSKKGRVEVLLDDGYWPCFSTVKSRSTHAQFGLVGEGFIKEVDFGRVWLRLNEAPEEEKDAVVAEWKGDSKAFLKATLEGPHTYALVDDQGRTNSTVMVEARYIPVPVKLEPRESVNNQGILRVTLVDGQEIRGVDRGGKSDPFAVFTLNGQKVYKSQTKKKTLTPEWNETFEVAIPSRYNADLTVEVFDWNQIEQSKSLGYGKFDLNMIEPMQGQDFVIPLTSSKHGEKGVIRLHTVFQPEIIAKSRKATSTFTSAGRAMTQIGGLPMSAGKGVFHGVTGVFKRDNQGEIVPPLPPPPGLAPAPAQEAVVVSDQPQGQPQIQPQMAATFPTVDAALVITHEPGTLRITLLDGQDVCPQGQVARPYAVIRVGDREYKSKHTASKTDKPEWNESFLFPASVATPKMYVWLHDHKTIGKDKELTEGDLEIWRHINPETPSSTEVVIQLKSGGLLRARLEFDPGLNPNGGSNGSLHSGEQKEHRDHRSMSFSSPSRFSLRGRRPNDDDSQ
ncbi:C2 domain-containing protein [Gymnopilus junonius]|uniref:C2 domain-containing protein n=1 Tax=Gymnopilus junonius TaxID=109634 RepID=A0A9P5NSR4_GYMJU|nr:C2 domain-containing protein [Gymnopilus junonius]